MKNSVGYNFIIPTFIDIAKKTACYDIQNIKVINGFGDGYTDSIEVWDDSGSMTDEVYWWCTYVDGGVSEEGMDGWYTEDGIRATDKVYQLGVGFYLNLQSDGATIQYAGQVYDKEWTSAPLAPGYNVIGNSTPVKITLQDVKLIDSFGDGYSDSIEVWDDSGSMTDEVYWWCTYVDGGVSEEGKDGWYTEDGDAAEIDLNAGEGIFINVQSGDNVKFSLPNPMTYVYPTK